MSSSLKFENKASKKTLSAISIQLCGNLEKIIGGNKLKEENIKKLEEMESKEFENKEILIKENSRNRAFFNTLKKTTELKREFLSNTVNNKNISNLNNLEKIYENISENTNKFPNIFNNIKKIKNLKNLKNQLLSKLIFKFVNYL